MESKPLQSPRHTGFGAHQATPADSCTEQLEEHVQLGWSVLNSSLPDGAALHEAFPSSCAIGGRRGTPRSSWNCPLPWAQRFPQILTCSLMEQLPTGETSEHPPRAPAGSRSFLSICSGAPGLPWQLIMTNLDAPSLAWPVWPALPLTYLSKYCNSLLQAEHAFSHQRDCK